MMGWTLRTIMIDFFTSFDNNSDIKCSKCGKHNPIDTEYCIKCGFPLEKKQCIYCNKYNDIKAEKCVKCGAEFNKNTTEQKQEQRNSTYMYGQRTYQSTFYKKIKSEKEEEKDLKKNEQEYKEEKYIRKCQQCFMTNDWNDKFCIYCGAKLDRLEEDINEIIYKSCPKCNVENDDDAKFCKNCGENLREKIVKNLKLKKKLKKKLKLKSQMILKLLKKVVI